MFKSSIDVWTIAQMINVIVNHGCDWYVLRQYGTDAMIQHWLGIVLI